jgi:hypothetical protein
MVFSCLLFAGTEAGRILLVMQLSHTLQAALEALFMVALGIAACVVRSCSFVPYLIDSQSRSSCVLFSVRIYAHRQHCPM